MAYPDETTGYFNASNGMAVFYRQRPAETERARLVLVHGLGEHSGRYAHVIDYLSGQGLSVWALDHQGHGKSQGKRGHIDRFDQYLKDLKHVVDMANRDKPQKTKTFLLGHSMGGLIALRFAETCGNAINGLIVSSPGLAPALKIPLIKGNAAKLISHIWPSLTFDNELDPAHLSHDTTVVKAYIEDPLVNRRISARWFTEFLAAMEATISSAADIRIPVLMQVAGADRIVSAQTSKIFFERLVVPQKTLFLYDDLYHEIYNEVKREKVFDDLSQWLQNHL